MSVYLSSGESKVGVSNMRGIKCQATTCRYQWLRYSTSPLVYLKIKFGTCMVYITFLFVIIIYVGSSSHENSYRKFNHRTLLSRIGFYCHYLQETPCSINISSQCPSQDIISACTSYLYLISFCCLIKLFIFKLNLSPSLSLPKDNSLYHVSFVSIFVLILPFVIY